MSSDPKIQTENLNQDVSQRSEIQQLKKGFSFKPSKIKEQEELISREKERKRIVKEKKQQQEEERRLKEEERKLKEEQKRLKEEEEKKNQPIYFQNKFQQKRKAVDFFSSSSSSSSSSSRSSSLDQNVKDSNKNKKKESKQQSSTTSRDNSKLYSKDDIKNSKVKREDYSDEERLKNKNKKNQKKSQESDSESEEDRKKKKKKRDKEEEEKKREKKEKKEKKKLKMKRKEKNDQLMKMNNEELDLYYDVINEKTKKAPEASQKFLYKHIFHRNCLPVSIISFGDKTILKYRNYGQSGDVPGYRLIKYAMIVGFKRDEESIGLFDDLNKDLGHITHYSRANKLKQQEKQSIRYFDRRFWEKQEETESEIKGFSTQKKIKPNNEGNELDYDRESFISFFDDKPAELQSSLSNYFKSEQSYFINDQNSLQQNNSSKSNQLQSLSGLSIKDYSDLKDLKVNAEDLSSEEIKLFQQNKEFNQKIKENPNDPYIWIDYIKLQDRGIKYSSQNQYSVLSIQQKKIGIIEKALMNEELRNNQILILYHMRVLLEISQGEDFYKVMNEKWMEYILKNIYNMLLWNNFLDYRYSNLLKFSATYFRESTAELLGQLSRMVQSSKQVSEIITLRRIILLIVRKISFIEEQMGFKERSFGILQALIELNVFCPPQIRRCQDSQLRLSEFKKYWEDFYCCKTGEIIGGGWDKQVENQKLTKEQKEQELNKSFIGKYNEYKDELIEMNEENWIDVEKGLHEALWRPANAYFDKDLIQYNSDTIVFTEDVQQFLIVLNDPESQISLINIMFENLGLPPVNDNIFISSENKAFSSFYSEKSKNLLQQMKMRTEDSNSRQHIEIDFKQYCGIDRLDFLNKFYSLSDESLILGGSQSRKKRMVAQLEYVRRLLYELHKKLDRESILIYIMWIEGIFFIKKAISPTDSIITEKQARINIKNILKQNEKIISLWVIYAEIIYEKSVQSSNNSADNLANTEAFIEIDKIFENVYIASQNEEKQKLSVLYFWSSFYLRQAGKVDISWIRENLLRIMQKVKPFNNTKNLILQLLNLMREQIAKEKQKLDPSLIPKMKTKIQKVFPLSKKSIYAYFLLLAHSLDDTGSTVNYQEYFDLIEETNNEKIKIWDDEELYARLQRKFQNESQLLLLNVLRIQRLTYYTSQENSAQSNYDSSRRIQELKSQSTQLYKTILNKYPFFSVAIVELVLFNIKETTRIDRLVSLKDILQQNNLFYSTWLLILFNEIASTALTDEKEIILSKLRYYFSEAQKDSQLIDKQISLLDKFRNQSIGIDSTTDYFNQISFLSLFNAFTDYFEPSKLANRSLQMLDQAPFSKEAYLYRLKGLEGEQRQKMREMIFEKEIRIIYADII